LLVKLTIPFLKAIHTIPVYHDYDRFQTTVQMTVERLKAGKQVLIFPEDPSTPLDPVYKMATFSKSMVRVAEEYYQQTRKRVAFYPVCVHESGQVRLGAPIRYSGLSAPSAERLRIKNYLEEAIKEMYRQSAGTIQIELPLPQG
jgi:1-acyl-sn-glycerol-3-phosphate acyltransferase